MMLPLEETGAVEIRLCQDGHLQWRDSAALCARGPSKQHFLQMDGEKKDSQMWQERQDKRAENSSFRTAGVPRTPGGVRTAGEQLNHFDDAESALPPRALHVAYPLAPEQIAVVCDAPSLTDAVARECLQALGLLHATATGTVLLLEPFVGTLIPCRVVQL
jgi:hypothetical protein